MIIHDWRNVGDVFYFNDELYNFIDYVPGSGGRQKGKLYNLRQQTFRDITLPQTVDLIYTPVPERLDLLLEGLVFLYKMDPNDELVQRIKIITKIRKNI